MEFKFEKLIIWKITYRPKPVGVFNFLHQAKACHKNKKLCILHKI